MELLLIWVLFGIVSAVVASNKGRSGCGWFLIGVLLGPFGLILSFVVSKNQETVEEVAISSGDKKKCPYCAELIRREAIVCRYCGKDLPSKNQKKDKDSKNRIPQSDRNISLEAEDYRTIGELETYANQKKDKDSKNRIPQSDRNISLEAEDYRTIGELETYAKQYGYSHAKYLLGMIYLEGQIVEKNERLAKHWLQKAADEKYEKAIEALNGFA